MESIVIGDTYASKFDGLKCTVNNFYRKGRGYQVCYKMDGINTGLVTSRGNFLDSFTLVKGESK